MEFTVTAAASATEGQVAQLFLAEADESGYSVDLQADLGEPDDSDLRLGMDTYYLSIGQDEAVHGGATRCRMTRDAIRIDFSSGAAAELGTANLVMHLDIPAADLPAIAGYLRTILCSGRAEEHPQLEIIGIE